MKRLVELATICATILLSSCVTAPDDDESVAPGITWVRHSAEYRALALQVYGMASRALPAMIENREWTALPDQENARDLPPAIIIDVDETALSNAGFQAALAPPFRDSKLNAWSDANPSVAVPGAAEFVQRAVDAGASVFFVTNRPCEAPADAPEPCPQEQVVIGDLVESGFPADASTVWLAYEKPAWTGEKSIRRMEIAETHRVIMLIGDDLGDFIPCTRKQPLDPCAAGATRASRRALVDQHANYWGLGWYVLPNPMHGSWTSVE